MPVRIKRIYDEPSSGDGKRILVDRLWPRGLSKEDADLDVWLKEVAPSDDLREWFDHDPEKWEEFRERYRTELEGKDDRIEELLSDARSGTVTLLYAATDEEHNNAVVLRDYLTEHDVTRSDRER